MEREFSALKKVPGVKSDCKAGPTRLTALNGRSKALAGMYLLSFNFLNIFLGTKII